MTTPALTPAQSLLSVTDLSVSFGDFAAVKGVSLTIRKGETVALVGESGSGKSTLALSILKLQKNARLKGQIKLGETDILSAPESTLRHIRGGKIGIIFQEPMTSLNPLHTIGNQVTEVLCLHKGLTGKKAHARTLELLKMAGLPNAAAKIKAYPHELSGGQRQRVMIAMALAAEPDLLIADEPTTALDVTIQKQILELLKDLQKRLGLAILFISHDLNLVKQIATTTHVMKDGKIVESGSTKDIMSHPQNPYTVKLVNSKPKGNPVPPPATAPILIDGKGLTVKYGNFTALDDVNIAITKGSTLGLVGESGSGKTTLGLALLDLLSRQSGKVMYMGSEIRHMRPLRGNMQIVFQDPYSSLNPRMSAEQIISEGLEIYERGLSNSIRRQKVIEVLEKVGLPASALSRYPHEFSGGQRQRIAISRALILKPDFIVLDEPTSALDVTVQVQIVELLQSLKNSFNLSYLLITHDIRIIKALADYICVMKDGKIIERGLAKDILESPAKDYTKTLIKAALL